MATHTNTSFQALTTVNDQLQAQCKTHMSIFNVANGGWLMTIIYDAVSTRYQGTIVAITGNFVRKVVVGTVQLQLDTIRQSRNTAVILAKILQNDQITTMFFVSIDYSNNHQSKILTFGLKPPILPPVEQCADFTKPIGFGAKIGIHILDLFCIRMVKTVNKEEGSSLSRTGYIRLRNNEVPTWKTCLFFLDVLAPPLKTLMSSDSWFPSVELSAYFRSSDTLENDWFRFSYATRLVSNNMFETDAELWDRAGTKLLVQSRQLMRVYKAKL